MILLFNFQRYQSQTLSDDTLSTIQPTNSNTGLPTTSTPIPISKSKVTPQPKSKLQQLYQDHIDPMTEYEMTRSNSRRILQPLEISTNSAFTRYDDELDKSRYSVQSWPQDRFTGFTQTNPSFTTLKFPEQPQPLELPIAQIESPNLFEIGFEDIFTSGFQNNEFQNDPNLSSPSIQRLLNGDEFDTVPLPNSEHFRFSL